MSLVGFKGKNHPQQVDVRGALEEVDDRGTDPEFFAQMVERFGPFTLDAAAAHHNAKCDTYYTRADDGLVKRWFGVVWCNPPYSDIGAWVSKAWHEWKRQRVERIVMLLPANRPEQGWWQSLVEPHRDRPGSPLSVEFLPGRMRFIKPGKTEIGPNERPPFGCCLLVTSTDDETPPPSDHECTAECLSDYERGYWDGRLNQPPQIGAAGASTREGEGGADGAGEAASTPAVTAPEGAHVAPAAPATDRESNPSVAGQYNASTAEAE